MDLVDILVGIVAVGLSVAVIIWLVGLLAYGAFKLLKRRSRAHRSGGR